MTLAYQNEVSTAMKAVTAAAQICSRVQQQISNEAMEKNDKSPVTVADFASQAVICRSLKESFADDPIVAEEDSRELRTPENELFREQIVKEITTSGITSQEEEILTWIDYGNHDGSADRYWTLDPIDGTKGFLRKEQFAISLALIEKGVIKVAALACPNLQVKGPADDQQGVILFAVAGHGAKAVAIGQPVEEAIDVRVAQTQEKQAARMCESVESGHSAHDWSSRVREQLDSQADSVRLDSQAKYAVVARGEADAYLRLPTRKGYEEKIWDHAGGVLVVEEAGGKVTDVDGKPLDFSAGATLKNNRGVVVTNGALHAEILQAVQAAE